MCSIPDCRISTDLSLLYDQESRYGAESRARSLDTRCLSCSLLLAWTAQRTGSRRTVRIEDQEFEWHPDFRLYMTSKLPNPHYSPEIAGKTMIINYTVCSGGKARRGKVGDGRGDVSSCSFGRGTIPCFSRRAFPTVFPPVMGPCF